MDRSPATASPRLSTFFASGRWGVLSRSLAAIFGGYALASMTSVFCAVALPAARGQAVLIGMLLVTLAPGISALALGGLLLDAQELLGRRVDVVTEASLHPALKNRTA